MKIKAIANLCKKNKHIILVSVPYGDGYRQWIGDGHAMYPIVGLPLLHKEEIFTLFEIKEEDQSKFCVMEEQQTDTFYDDSDLTEKLIDLEKIRIATANAIIRPVQTSQGVAFFDTKYLAPLAELNNMELYERRNNGKLHFVVKSGFLLYGIIMPYQIITKDFTEALSRIAFQCEEELKKHEYEEESQITINYETGEIEDEKS